jgi:hypothetical protein
MRRQWIWMQAATCALTFSVAAPLMARTTGQPPPHAQAQGHDKAKKPKKAKPKGAHDHDHSQPQDWDPRFHGLDDNDDNVISRGEWNGDSRSFANHDWNRDGVLSGNELIAGATRPGTPPAPRPGADPDQAEFARLDGNRDNRLSRGEWNGSAGDFDRLDVNRDGLLSPYEFGVGR